MARGRARWPESDEPWIDVWGRIPDQLKDRIRQMAAEGEGTLLDIVESLLWLGLVRQEEARRRAGARPRSGAKAC